MSVFEIVAALLVAVVFLVALVFAVQLMIDTQSVPYIVQVKTEPVPLQQFRQQLRGLLSSLARRAPIKRVEFMHSDVVEGTGGPSTVFSLLIYVPKGSVVTAVHGEVVCALRFSQINYRRVDVAPHLPYKNID